MKLKRGNDNTMKDTLLNYHDECGKIIFLKKNDPTPYENYDRTIIHDQFRCYSFKHYKKLFEKLEEDLQTVRTDMQKIQEVLF